MNGNEIKELPAEIGALVNLKELDLSHNCLASLPAEFSALRRLAELDISHNELTTLPAGIKSFQQICQVKHASASSWFVHATQC
jgi:Leucine-rich repeat (LRR) protein